MRTDYIKPSQYKAVLQLMEYENALALRVSLETGLRISDVLALTKDSLQARTVHFTASKTGKAGRAVLSADLAKRLRGISGSKWIFEGRSGEKPRTRQAVWKDVKKATRALELRENVGCHSARKTFAVTDFQENGLKQTQKDLQHDRAETTMLYAFSNILTGQKSHNVGADELLPAIAEMIENAKNEIINCIKNNVPKKGQKER